MVRRQTWLVRRFEIFESARHFRIESNRDVRFEFESGRPIRIRIESRSFGGPYARDVKNNYFRSISRFISQMMQDRAIVTMEGE